MAETLPEDPRKSDDDAFDIEGGNLTIENFNYYGNDLRELRRLAEVDPELAKQVISQRDRENQRENTSYRFGLASSVILALAILAAITVLPISVGVVPALIMIGIVLAVALLIRVILTGEWSETTWFGKLVEGLAKALGSRSD